MNKILHLSLTLMVISAISALSIAFVNRSTAPQMYELRQEQEQEALRQVAPEYDSIIHDTVQYKDSLHEYWTVLHGDTLAAYIFSETTQGYAGAIEYLVGISPSGDITGMSILSHEETPGLGARISEIPSSRTMMDILLGRDSAERAPTPWFTDQFTGLSVTSQITADRSSSEWPSLSQTEQEHLRDTNTITVITGATISTEAVLSSLFTTPVELHSKLLEKGSSHGK
ncbi:RnfABCDGE type electron transport complex subunit G [Chitinivibrio alkaliphilus]|uniref:Ion-translocating oxidoreductase complex subunit G n=1 Tax=Chitinivibrio alkaliphilus ACht1 TaxID=1313304 RepID=U7D966_9BACT|nr:RnfABCDGE type electron transport complex subunit G [Chitinivibrio alkaliphilus]ERP32126.1 electron transport complex, RnfABCDGE type, G subunit [Chitinivibrio alkaliphilus ACht1]